MIKTVLITGANGFIGKNLTCRLIKDGRYNVIAAVRHEDIAVPEGAQKLVIGDLSKEINWERFLKGVDCVVHTAAIVHVIHPSGESQKEVYERINVNATQSILEKSILTGLKQFIFLSSIKVNGEHTELDGFFSPEDKPKPADDYAVSKYDAESRIISLTQGSKTSYTIIRPPLVYGPGVKANFERLIKLIDKGIPLPFGLISNSRSLIYIDNLVDFIAKTIDCEKAGNKIFIPSDGTDTSTSELMRKISLLLGKPIRLIGVPSKLIRAVFFLLGRKAEAERLFGSLRVYDENIERILNWKAPVTMYEGLSRTVEAYRQNKQKKLL